jgi:formylglycine-generating enzyme required for sulfatase activity
MSGKVFICYRKEDARWIARSVKESLDREFPGLVFLDDDGLQPGDHYRTIILDNLYSSGVVLAVMGPKWEPELVKRLAGRPEDDWVRVELREAFERKIPVIPVLVEDARLVPLDKLPPDLHNLHKAHWVKISSDQFQHGMKGLAGAVRSKLAAAHAKKPTAAPAQAPETKAVPAKGLGNSRLPPSAKTIRPPGPLQKEAPAWASKTGSDTHGRWAEFTVGEQVQRLRWMKPGSFWMGSPATEKERDQDEVRHRVTLTQGFWMADTACTQGLWQAVMGDNPSKFTGDARRPVERVSWDDVMQRFLPELSRQVAGLQAVLPTEAQWEYACRSGTETPFCFGEQITPQQVNYDGNYPYAGGAKGEYREKTVPVKSLPPNDWGLYEVHGNVWEWCADGYGPYYDGEVTDPTGIPNAGSRVLRGGSWRYYAKGCRAALRNWVQPDFRYYYTGFRLCVSSPI